MSHKRGSVDLSRRLVVALEGIELAIESVVITADCFPDHEARYVEVPRDEIELLRRAGARLRKLQADLEERRRRG